MTPLSQTRRNRLLPRLPLLAAGLMLMNVLWGTAALGADSVPAVISPVTVEPSMLTVITHAGIVYGIAIAISALTAILIKLMNVVMAARSGNEAEQA